MTRTAQLGIAGLLVASAVVAAFVLRPDRAPESEAVRPSFGLAAPSPAEKAAFLFELMGGGAQEELKGARLPIWQLIGERALLDLDEAALDYMLSEERYPLYRRAPSVLANVLRMLPSFRRAGAKERLYPFLLHWIEKKNVPPPTPRGDWHEEFRRLIFNVFQAFPDDAAVPFSVEELRRKERVHDLRTAALSVLLQTGHGSLIPQLFSSLPPKEDEPAPDLRAQLVQRLYEMAASTVPPPVRARVGEMRSLLIRLLDSRPAERLNAMGALLRLGDRSMADRLVAEFERFEKTDERIAWSALGILGEDEPHPYVREAALRRIESRDGRVGYATAVRLLTRWWGNDPDVLRKLWSHTEAREDFLHPGMILPGLTQWDRPGVVEFLKAEIASGDARRVQDAVRIARGENIREVGPRLMELARTVPREQRPSFYAALVALRISGVEALLIAEFEAGDRVGPMHGAAAAELLNLAGDRGLAQLAAALRDGDVAVVQALLVRARSLGRAGVAEPLLDPLLDALERLPGEEDRRLALFVLRFRGTLAGVRDRLMKAYEREPSRRVAADIRRILVELAHR